MESQPAANGFSGSTNTSVQKANFYAVGRDFIGPTYFCPCHHFAANQQEQYASEELKEGDPGYKAPVPPSHRPHRPGKLPKYGVKRFFGWFLGCLSFIPRPVELATSDSDYSEPTTFTTCISHSSSPDISREEFLRGLLDCCNLTTAQTYAWEMWQTGRGYALFYPGLSEPSPKQLGALPSEGGIAVGDVVTINSQGQCTVTFNIWDDEPALQRSFRCLGGTSLLLPPKNVTTRKDIIRGSSIAEGASCEVNHDEYNSRKIDSFDFRSSPNATRGAFLAATSDADSEELVDYTQLRKWIIEHAKLIYIHANSVRQIAADESLYIVTSCTKTDSWALAAFRKPLGSAQLMRLKNMTGNRNGDPRTSYAWKHTWASSEARVGWSEQPGVKDQTLFLRGFKIDFSPQFRQRMDDEQPPSRISSSATRPSENTLHSDPNGGTGGPDGDRPAQHEGRGGSSNSEGSSAGSSRGRDNRPQEDSDRNDTTCNSTSRGTHTLSRGVTVQSFPFASRKSCHPSDAFNKYLLAMTGADFALCHDDQWRLVLANLNDPLDLMKVVLDEHDIVTYHGVALLSPESLDTNDVDLENRRSTTESSLSAHTTPTPHPSDDQEKPATRPDLKGRFYLTDAEIERIGNAEEGMLPSSLTELRVSSADALDSIGGSSPNNRNSSVDTSLPARVGKTLQGWQEVLPLLRKKGSHSLADDVTAILGSAAELMRLFEATGDFSHLEDADEIIRVGARAVQERLTETTVSEEAAALHERGVELWERFQVTGDPELVDEAIAVRKRELQLVPEDHKSFPGILHHLSCSLVDRYKHTGDISHLAEAISTQRRAITLTPDGFEDLPNSLHTLGILLRNRYTHTGEPSDLDEGLSAHQRAIQLGPDDDLRLPGWLNGLGDAIHDRFVLTGDLSYLDEAISVLRRVVSLTADGQERLSRYLNNLGSYLGERYDTTGNLPDLNEAISAQQRSVQLTPDGHPELPSRFSNLGCLLMDRFPHTRDPSDIAQGLSAQERAVDLTPGGHADLPMFLFNLGTSLHTQHSVTGSWEALSRSLSSYRLAATCTSGAPKIRLKAAKKWVNLLGQHDPRSTDILAALGVALGLVSLISGLEQTVQGRHSQLRDVSGMSLEAAAAAFILGYPDKALEFLEQGRCLVWNQFNSLRTPLDTLRMHDRQLAERIRKVSAQLEHAGSSRQHSSSGTSLQEKCRLEDEALEHVNLAKQWDSLLREVRSKPGFETFLRPPTSATLLQHLPESGVVVVINIDKKRCDAIALMAGLDEPLHIPLPNFSWEKAEKHCQDLGHRLQADGLRMRKKPKQGQVTSSPAKKPEVPVLRNVLRGLWVDVVKPILEGVAYVKMDSTREGPTPRIWWCPTGPLSFLPLHAAGIYEGSLPENVLDYAVSSYTPTVTSLADRIKNRCPIPKSASGLFLTCQPNGIPHSPIPGTVEEVDSILGKAMEKKVRVLKLAGSEVSGEDCLKHMEEYSSVHLACHASQDTIQPLQSRFFFHEGSLELSTILKRNMRNADLAFLSACKTSVGEEKLADEAVHLAAGMLAAGYRRVIATMWSINDEQATKVAKSFYQYLWEHPTDASREGGFDGTLSAYALHHAIQELRRELGDSDDSILAWAPFIHYGY